MLLLEQQYNIAMGIYTASPLFRLLIRFTLLCHLRDPL